MEKDYIEIRKKLLKENIDPEAFEDSFFPFEITWFITFACNLKCPYCFLPEYFYRFSSSPPVDALKVLKRCKEKKIFKINVLGGEPFLCRKTVIELAKNCEKFGIVYRSTSTNGVIYDGQIVEALKTLKFKHILQVSLDASNPRTYFLMRKNNNFKLVLKNISRYVKNGLHVMLGMTLTKHNISEIEDFAKLAEKIGAEMVSYGGMVPLGRGKEVQGWRLSFKEMKDAYKRIKALKTIVQVVLPNDVYGQTCAAGVGQASMLPNGDLYPCNMFLGVEEAKIGNLFDEKLNKYNNAWFIRLSANRVPKKCDECELPPLCDRACKAVSYDYFGDFVEHKPFCEL